LQQLFDKAIRLNLHVIVCFILLGVLQKPPLSSYASRFALRAGLETERMRFGQAIAENGDGTQITCGDLRRILQALHSTAGGRSARLEATEALAQRYPLRCWRTAGVHSAVQCSIHQVSM
jgi:hypothetical protein